MKCQFCGHTQNGGYWNLNIETFVITFDCFKCKKLNELGNKANVSSVRSDAEIK